MREILFRGKRVGKETWVFGHYVEQYGSKMIYLTNGIDSEHGFDSYHIDPETVGQYTGLTDKNGNKIFEGDIVRCFGEAGDEHIVVIEWRQERAMFVLKTLEKEPFDFYIDSSDFFMLLGNIHDNPELLRTPQNDEVRE